MGDRGPKNEAFTKVLSDEEQEELAYIINERGTFAAQSNVYISDRVVYRTTFPIYKLKTSVELDDLHVLSDICDQHITVCKNSQRGIQDWDITLTNKKLVSIMEMIWDDIDDDRKNDYMAVIYKCVDRERICECETHVVV